MMSLLPPASAGLLLGILFDAKDGGDVLLRNVGPSPKYTELQPGKPYFSRKKRSRARTKEGFESGTGVNLLST
jgi:hypothetical protein